MATIVLHKPSGRRYILLGAGYGQWATARANALLGDLFPAERSGHQHLLCLCDAEGKVEWAVPENCEVVSVDGRTPGEVLGADGAGDGG